MSRRIRKPTMCISENKSADQLRGNREADQRLCVFATQIVQFLFFLNPKFSRLDPASVTVQAGLCWTWSELQIVGFLMQIVDFILILGTEGEDNLRIQTAKRRHKVSRTKETV